jgi:hypothetical protein
MLKIGKCSSSIRNVCNFERLNCSNNRNISRSYSSSSQVSLKSHSELIHEYVQREVMALKSNEIEKILFSVSADRGLHDPAEREKLLIRLELEAIAR